MSKRNKKDEPFTIIQHQLDNEVTGSCYLVECDGEVILINYGSHQDNSLPLEKVYDINRQKIKIPLDKVTVSIYPEAHFDHIGIVGINGRKDIDYNGIGYATEPTAEAMRYILLDSSRIMQSDCDKHNLYHKGKEQLRPLYNKDEVENAVADIRCYGYEESIKLTSNLSFEFLPNGHLLGSGMVYMTYDDGKIIRRLLITSDYYYGDTPRPFTKSIINKCIKADVIVTESTYGNRYHSKENPMDVLEKVIEEYVVGKNKILFIPTFAMSRSSSLYYYLNDIFKKNKKISDANIPVYFCGGLMDNLHTMYGKKQYDAYKDEQWIGHEELFNGVCGFKSLAMKKDIDTFVLNGNSRKIVIASSGMISGGFSTMIAEKFVENNKVVMMCSGYVAEGTIAYEICREDVQTVKINTASKTKRLKVLPTLPNMSSHADANGLVAFIKSCNQHVLKKVLICHGGEEERIALKESLEKELNKKIEVKVFNQYDKVKF